MVGDLKELEPMVCSIDLRRDRPGQSADAHIVGTEAAKCQRTAKHLYGDIWCVALRGAQAASYTGGWPDDRCCGDAAKLCLEVWKGPQVELWRLSRPVARQAGG